MNLIERFGIWQATKLVRKYTGQIIKPEFYATCYSDITPYWRGVVLLDNDRLWLVNSAGAKGVRYKNLSPWPTNGQFPKGTKGYPGYEFRFNFKDTPDSIRVSPILAKAGLKLENQLSKKDFS